MEPENQKQNILPALLAVLVVFVFVLLGYSTVSEESRFKFKKDRVDTKENINSLPKESALAVAHHFSGGLHTYAGAIETPTPCYKVSSKIFSQKSTPEIIKIQEAFVLKSLPHKNSWFHLVQVAMLRCRQD